MDSICTNAERIAKFGGGGTDCHLPLALLNQKNKSADNLIYISDNESWCDNDYENPTATMIEWTKFKNRNKTAKLINIDIQPSSTTQTNSIKDILNIGGFSDQIFSVIDNFIRDGRSDEYWVDTINKVSI
jgi:60 kDa SS-A/Ro ribonucleoprotein